MNASEIGELVARTLAEDLGAPGDVTTRAVVDPDQRCAARIVARADGVIAGSPAAIEVFRQVDPAVVVEWMCRDGDVVSEGTTVARVEGRLASILVAERSALNLLSHASGVATCTKAFVDLVGPRTKIRDTRKTSPGLRALEKDAVRAGGGWNHRASLSDAVLIKDNHLVGTSIADAVARARSAWPDLVIEVECDTLAQVHEAGVAGVDVVLVDNMSPTDVAAAIAALPVGTAVEVSGGVTLQNVEAYAAVEPTYISVGAITHSAPILDLALDIDAKGPQHARHD